MYILKGMIKINKLRIPYKDSHKIIESIEYKLCRSCGRWFPLNEKYFNKDKSLKDGFCMYCKECINEKQNKKYKLKAKIFTKREPDVKKVERIGEVNVNKWGSRMEIAEYNNAHDILVKFQNTNEPLVHTSYWKFYKGEVRSDYDKTVYGVGYLGYGDYRVKENGITLQKYKVWNSMIQRCYDLKFQENSPTYIGCSVTDEWHNYQNFAKWYDENYYEIKGYTMQLDKDILVKGNKVYSPNTCVFAPNTINILFIKRSFKKSKLPIGVTKRKNRYVANCTIGDNKHNLGSFKTPEEAFYAYKKQKEIYLKQIAEKYKKYIPEKLYKTLYNYIVEIND